jgi:hypothetical protein
MVDPQVLQKAKDRLDAYVKNQRVVQNDEDTFYLIEGSKIPGYIHSTEGSVVALPKRYTDQLVEVNSVTGQPKLDGEGNPIPLIKPEDILYTANVVRDVNL